MFYRFKTGNQFVECVDVVAQQPGGRVDRQRVCQRLTFAGKLLFHEALLAGNHVGHHQPHQHGVKQQYSADDPALEAMEEKVG